MRKLGLLSLEKAQGNLVNVYKYMRAVCREGRIRLFSDDRTRDKKHKTETLEALSPANTFFFTVILNDHLHRQSREFVESSWRQSKATLT